MTKIQELDRKFEIELKIRAELINLTDFGKSGFYNRFTKLFDLNGEIMIQPKTYGKGKSCRLEAKVIFDSHSEFEQWLHAQTRQNTDGSSPMNPKDNYRVDIFKGGEWRKAEILGKDKHPINLYICLYTGKPTMATTVYISTIPRNDDIVKELYIDKNEDTIKEYEEFTDIVRNIINNISKAIVDDIDANIINDINNINEKINEHI